jgi:hypothetical protein
MVVALLSQSRVDPISSLNQNLGEHGTALHISKKGMPTIIPEDNSLRDGRPVDKNSWINCNTIGPDLI